MERGHWRAGADAEGGSSSAEDGEDGAANARHALQGATVVSRAGLAVPHTVVTESALLLAAVVCGCIPLSTFFSSRSLAVNVSPSLISLQ